MKRKLALMLTLAMLCAACAVPAVAATNFSYEGIWAYFEDLGFSMYLPKAWMRFQPEDDSYVFGSEDGANRMVVTLMEVPASTMEDVLADFSTAEGYENVTTVMFGKTPFVIYEYPQADVFGAVTLSEDGALAYYFKFFPNSDQQFGVVAGEIMASLTVRE